MGTWGAGLYSSDFALDLRSTVAAIIRLPFEPAELLRLLCDSESQAAREPRDEDHTTFWLTVADQFAKRGIDCPEARERALAIVAEGTDIKTMAELGADERTLKKRSAMLAELASRLAGPPPPKPRKVLKAPQPLLYETGAVLAYPISAKGEPINPYVPASWPAWYKWDQAGWGAFIVAEHGHVFDFLAWYRPLVLGQVLANEPDLARIQTPCRWQLRRPGTLSASHASKMRLVFLGQLALDRPRIDTVFPKRPSPVSAARSDISIANHLNVHDLHDPQVMEMLRKRNSLPPTSLIESLAEISGPAA